MRKLTKWMVVAVVVMVAVNAVRAADAPKAKEEAKAESKALTIYPTAIFPFEERGAGAKDLGAKVADILFAKMVVNPDLYLWTGRT